MTWKDKLIEFKAYFETGQGIGGHIKPFLYIWFTLMVSKEQWFFVALSVIGWGLICVALGWYWFKSGLQQSQTSFSNKYNPELMSIKDSVVKRGGN